MVDKPTRLATPGLDHEHRTWFDPEDILDAFGVKAGSVCVELGCGEGTFTYPLAHRLGKDGKVYAVDTSLAALDQLKIKKPGVNIVTLRAEFSETRLGPGMCDLVLMTFALSSTADPGSVLAEASRLLKPNGRLAVIEWRPVPPPPGPPMERRIRSDRMQRLVESHGFVGATRLREGSVYYTLSAQKGKPAPAPAARPPVKQAPGRPVRR